MSKEAVIVSRARTPIGSFQGSLSALSAPRLGAIAVKAAVERARIKPQDIDEVIMGQVLTAGSGQAPARQAAIYADLPTSVSCTTINKVCGSGLKAVMMARQAILLGDAHIVVAGGMEAMSSAPYLLPTARSGMRLGNQLVEDSLIHDGLLDPYSSLHMGNFGDKCAAHYGFSREEQDQFSKSSYERALHAQQQGYFTEEVVPVSVQVQKKNIFVDIDEEPKRYMPEKMAVLKTAFSAEGTITAANSSKINDGAAALVIMDQDEARRRKISPLAKIISSATFSADPAWFITAPVGAIKQALKNAHLSVSDIDLFEINEAFAVVTMVAMRELQISQDRVNVWGGAVALGHPIGCSGARILTTLLSAMIQKSAKTGCATLCIGGGEAVAVIVQQ
jgi:acetyl-CoA C-acetyltransferase